MKEYTVTINGVEHTLLLSDEDAERYAQREGVEVKGKSSSPSNKARAASDK